MRRRLLWISVIMALGAGTAQGKECKGVMSSRMSHELNARTDGHKE